MKNWKLYIILDFYCFLQINTKKNEENVFTLNPLRFSLEGKI